MNTPPVLKSAEKICSFIGENYKNIAMLVRDENLPAWKRNDKGPWLALPDDLIQWLREQRDKYLKPCQ